jgi:hypothetical protein
MRAFPTHLLGLFVACGVATAVPPTPPLSPRVFDLTQLTGADTFSDKRGYGFDLGTQPSATAPHPYFFSVVVPEGNYRVTVVFGDAQAPSDNTVRAESRQLLL